MVTAVKVTHIPSGESFVMDNSSFTKEMTISKMIRKARQVVKSRMVAMGNGINRSDVVNTTYELPDNDSYPQELEEYRKPIGMWDHKCPVDGHVAVGKGEECNWCGATEEDV